MNQLQELQNQVNALTKQVGALTSKRSLEDIILNSNYYCLVWTGFTTGISDFSPAFDTSLIYNKKLLIKSIRLIPFAIGDTDEFYDSTSGDHFIVKENMRLHKVIDEFTSVGRIKIIANGSDIPLFPASTSNYQVLDLFVDNIYFNLKNIVTNLRINIDGDAFNNIETEATDYVKMKLLMEVYSYQ